jgi:hypothetical protein
MCHCCAVPLLLPLLLLLRCISLRAAAQEVLGALEDVLLREGDASALRAYSAACCRCSINEAERTSVGLFRSIRKSFFPTSRRAAQSETAEQRARQNIGTLRACLLCMPRSRPPRTRVLVRNARQRQLLLQHQRLTSAAPSKKHVSTL